VVLLFWCRGLFLADAQKEKNIFPWVCHEKSTAHGSSPIQSAMITCWKHTRPRSAACSFFSLKRKKGVSANGALWGARQLRTLCENCCAQCLANESHSSPVLKHGSRSLLYMQVRSRSCCANGCFKDHFSRKRCPTRDFYRGDRPSTPPYRGKNSRQ